MSGFLLDTNVVSETKQHRPSPRVIAFFFDSTDRSLAVVPRGARAGVRAATPAAGRRRERLRANLSRFLGTYAQRILHLDRASADWAARLRADAVRSGRPADLADMLIAGTALAHSLAVATRNDWDLEGVNM